MLYLLVGVEFLYHPASAFCITVQAGRKKIYFTLYFCFAFKLFSMHFLPQSIKQSFNMASTGILSKSGDNKWLITCSRMGFNNSCTWFFSHLFLYMLLLWSLKLFPWHCLWPSFILNIAENFLRFFFHNFVFRSQSLRLLCFCFEIVCLDSWHKAFSLVFLYLDYLYSTKKKFMY